MYKPVEAVETIEVVKEEDTFEPVIAPYDYGDDEMAALQTVEE